MRKLTSILYHRGLCATLCTYPLTTMALEKSVGHQTTSPSHAIHAIFPYLAAVGLSNGVFWGINTLLAGEMGDGFFPSLFASVLATVLTHPVWLQVNHFRVYRSWAGNTALSRGLVWNLVLTLFPAVRSGAEILLAAWPFPTTRFILASLLATIITWPLQVWRNRAQVGVNLSRGRWSDGLGWQCAVSAISSGIFFRFQRLSVAALEWFLGL